jgi:hypothetical protein
MSRENSRTSSISCAGFWGWNGIGLVDDRAGYAVIFANPQEMRQQAISFKGVTPQSIISGHTYRFQGLGKRSRPFSSQVDNYFGQFCV